MALKKKSYNYYRLAIQWIIIILLTMMVVHSWFDKDSAVDFEAYCPFGGMQSLSSFLVNNVLACSMTITQISMGVALIIAVILVSKLFCSYICPIGIFSEWLGKIGEALKMRYSINGIADRLLRLLKYALLFITFYFTINSGELFCKKYDPYYALFSGFSSDVVIMYAIISIAIMVLGAIFIRLFWCKYLCPLSAATNIFSNAIVFIAITLIYVLLIKVFNVNISWTWYLGAVCLSGFLLESIRLKGVYFPLLKITRNTESCTNCKLCDRACPVGINVSQQISVKHIDCHLCGDCIESCPEKGTLKINQRNWRWIPPIAIIVLVAVGILVSDKYELPTVNKRWGTEQQFSNAKEYSQTGIKNIKCYGSCMSFVSQMRDVPGILGLEAYVKTHSVKIFYDPNVTDPEKIKAAIFSPTKKIIKVPSSYNGNFSKVNLYINNYFDSYDSYYLAELLSLQKGVFGLETSFGEPVLASFYYDSGLLNPEKIKNIVELQEYYYESDGKKHKQEINFKVSKIEDKIEIVSIINFMEHFVSTIDRKFNNYDECNKEDIGIYKIEMPLLSNPEYKDSLDFLISHISFDEGIVGMQTSFEVEGPMAYVLFNIKKTTTDKIFETLSSPSLKILYEDGSADNIHNPFVFKNKGIIKSKIDK